MTHCHWSTDWEEFGHLTKRGYHMLLLHENGYVERVRFEIVPKDEDDGPWDIRGGEPWCSYIGRSAGLYCHHYQYAEQPYQSEVSDGFSKGIIGYMLFPSGEAEIHDDLYEKWASENPDEAAALAEEIISNG